MFLLTQFRPIIPIFFFKIIWLQQEFDVSTVWWWSGIGCPTPISWSHSFSIFREGGGGGFHNVDELNIPSNRNRLTKRITAGEARGMAHLQFKRKVGSETLIQIILSNVALDAYIAYIYKCGFLCRIPWRQMSSREWRCSWSSAGRRCSNYIWVIGNFIAY